MNAKPTQIKEALQNYKKIVVIGLSPNEERPSNSVTRYMIRKGYNIVGVNPGHASILDQPCYNSLSEVPGQVEIVDVFRDSKAVPEIVDQAIQMKAKVLWLQEGVTHPEAEEKAAKAGILVISNLCILKEHRKYIQHNEGTKEKSQAV
ncbi:MAG: CoA-binding protein [Bdellovibrionota bacterium]